MTRTSGDRVIQTRCCGVLLRTPSYSSINFSANEQWTDGRVVGSLFENGGGLRRCTCGKYFLLSDATTLRVIEKQKPRAPKNWDCKSASWWHRLWGFPTREHILQTYDTRDPALLDEEENQLPPRAIHIADSELAEVISSPTLPNQVEITARRRYWRFLNDSYRSVYRHAREKDQDAIPSYEPTLQQRQNMERLLSLLETQTTKDWVEIAELLRQLGELTAAKNALKFAQTSQTNDVSLQNQLISQGVRAPVRFRH
jgi:hypothetical protein